MLEAFVEVDFTDVGSFQWISEFGLKVRCRHWTVCDDYSIGHEWFRNTEIQWTVPCLGEYCTAQRRSKYQTVNQYRNVIIMKGHRDQLHSFSHTYQNPTRQICSGAFSHGILLNTPLLSRAFIIIGGITVAKYLALIFMPSLILIDRGLLIPGVAMTTLEKITCAIPFSAALLGEQRHHTSQLKSTIHIVRYSQWRGLICCSVHQRWALRFWALSVSSVGYWWH